jgi:hypothetical protein
MNDDSIMALLAIIVFGKNKSQKWLLYSFSRIE